MTLNGYLQKSTVACFLAGPGESNHGTGQTSGLVAVFLLLIALWTGCSQHSDQEAFREAQEVTIPAANSRQMPLPELSPDQIQRLLELEKAVLQNPDNAELHRQVLEAGVFPEHGVLVAAGVGLLKNAENGAPIPQALARRAATLDAQRWAAYLLQWYRHGPELAFGTLSTRFVSPSQPVVRLVQNDSLVLVLAFQLPR